MTDRLGGDLLADKRFSKQEVKAALSTLLSLPPENVVVENWSNLSESSLEDKVVCRSWHLDAGEFRTVLDLPDSLLATLPRMSTAARLSMLLGCRLLVDDGSINPFSFLLFDATGGYRAVSVNVEAWERNEYSIVAVR